MTPLEQKFYDKISHIDNNGCMIWGGSYHADGSPRMWYKRREIRTHRVAYGIAGKKLSDSYVLISSCGDKRCVNYEHFTPIHRSDYINLMRAEKGWNFLQVKQVGVLKDRCSRGHDLVPGSYYEYKKKNKIQRECKLCVKIRLQKRRKKIKTEKNK